MNKNMKYIRPRTFHWHTYMYQLCFCWWHVQYFRFLQQLFRLNKKNVYLLGINSGSPSVVLLCNTCWTAETFTKWWCNGIFTFLSLITGAESTITSTEDDSEFSLAEASLSTGGGAAFCVTQPNRDIITCEPVVKFNNTVIAYQLPAC